MDSAARQEIERLVFEHGVITPRQLVEEATDEGSPLHPYFEWDDEIAAGRYRIVQARDLIRRYKVTLVESEESVVQVRAFMSVGDGYMATDMALSNPETRDVVLQQALRDLNALRRKYETLIEFSELLAAWQAKSA